MRLQVQPQRLEGVLARLIGAGMIADPLQQGALAVVIRLEHFIDIRHVEIPFAHPTASAGGCFSCESFALQAANSSSCSRLGATIGRNSALSASATGRQSSATRN